MRFRLSRLTLGEWLVGLASLALIVDVFALPWFHMTGGWWAYPPLSSVQYSPSPHVPLGPGPVILHLPQANGWKSSSRRSA